MWNLKPERWGSLLVQEKYQEDKGLWQETSISNNNNNNNNVRNRCGFEDPVEESKTSKLEKAYFQQHPEGRTFSSVYLIFNIKKKWFILTGSISFCSVNVFRLPVIYYEHSTHVIQTVICDERERKPTRCNNQMFIINFCLNMFQASLCPSSGEQRPCAVLAPYNAAPHNRYQPHPAESAQHTTCSDTRSLFFWRWA